MNLIVLSMLYKDVLNFNAGNKNLTNKEAYLKIFILYQVVSYNETKQTKLYT